MYARRWLLASAHRATTPKRGLVVATPMGWLTRALTSLSVALAPMIA
jgi:hypothetical protein